MCGLCLPHCPTYRISLDEAKAIFEKLTELGFRVTPIEQ